MLMVIAYLHLILVHGPTGAEISLTEQQSARGDEPGAR
jgi:hypothetical protein